MKVRSSGYAAMVVTFAASAAALPIAHASAPAFPRTIHSVRMPASKVDPPEALKPGTPVNASTVTNRVHLTTTIVAGLADKGAEAGAVYPALSQDDGTTWTIDGPLFYRAAADAPNVTSRLEALGRHTLIAWGPGGNFVKTSTDRGEHWRDANFPDGVEHAGTAHGHLTVQALGNQTSSGHTKTRRYTSQTGRIWHRR
jgi:hypothetical protein